MLRASRRGVFRRRYLLTEDDRPLTELTGLRREGWAFTADGASLRVERERSRRFVLTGRAGRVAAADRESGRRWAVTTSSGQLTLVRPSFWRSGWELRDGDRVVGRLAQDGAFSRSAHAELPADLPLAVRVFVFCVVLVVWERANSAGAAAAASS